MFTKKVLLFLSCLFLLISCQKTSPIETQEATTETSQEITQNAPKTTTEEENEEELMYKMIEATKSSATGKEYNLKEFGISFQIPSKYSNYNAFSDLFNDEGIFIPIIESNSEKEASARVIGDMAEFATAISVYMATDENGKDKTLMEEFNEFKSYAGVVSEEKLQIDGFEAKKIIYKSFGNVKITRIICKVNDRFYNFSAKQDETELLNEILNSVDFHYEKEKSVSDYFNEIPNKYFMDLSLASRKSSIDTLDLENYYIHFSPLELDGNGSMTVFLHNNEHLIATEIKGCGPICQQELHFFKYKNGNFIDVTNEYLPELDFETKMASFQEKNPDMPFVPIFVLPRYGTTIKVINQIDQEILYELLWRDGKFELKN